MLRKSKIGRQDRKLLPSPPTINDFNHFLEEALKLDGRWVDFSWRGGKGALYTVSVSYSSTLALPVWRLYGGDESRSLQWEYQTCDLPLVFNLVASHADMSERIIQADGALSRTRGIMGEAHTQYYDFQDELAAKSGQYPAVPSERKAEAPVQPAQPAQVQPSPTQPVPVQPQPSQAAPQAQTSWDLTLSGASYPEQLVWNDSGLITYPGLLLLLERECERSKRSKYPTTLLLFAADSKEASASEDHTAQSRASSVIPYIVIVQRKSDALAHYKEGLLALVLPNTTVTGAKVAARRILRALENSGDSSLAPLSFSFAAIDVIADGPTLPVVLAAAEDTVQAARRTNSKILAYRDMLMGMTPEQRAECLKRQSKAKTEDQDYSSLIQQAKSELVSDLTGVYTEQTCHFFLDFDQKRALREKRPLSMLMIDVKVKPIGTANTVIPLTSSRREVLRWLARSLRKVDILAEHDSDKFVLLLPDTTVYGAKQLANRITTLAQQELSFILGPAVKVDFELSVADALKGYPKLTFQTV